MMVAYLHESKCPHALIVMDYCCESKYLIINTIFNFRVLIRSFIKSCFSGLFLPICASD